MYVSYTLSTTPRPNVYATELNKNSQLVVGLSVKKLYTDLLSQAIAYSSNSVASFLSS